MIPIYIIHYPALTERREYLEPLLPDANWITDPRREDLTEEVSQEWYLPSEEAWHHKCTGYYKSEEPFRLQAPGDICCSLGHIRAWEALVDSEADRALFLEDDVVLCDHFVSHLHVVDKCSPPETDALFIGGGFQHTIAKTKEVKGNYHLKDHPATNCLCSYILTKQCATQILASIKPFTVPIDFELNYWFDKLNLNVFHHVPYIAAEGTATGKYKSIQVR